LPVQQAPRGGAVAGDGAGGVLPDQVGVDRATGGCTLRGGTEDLSG
jgi:hypothetical protein